MGTEGIDYVWRGVKRRRKIALIDCVSCGKRAINRSHHLCSKCHYALIVRHNYKYDRKYHQSYYDKNKERIQKKAVFQRKQAIKSLGNRCCICGRRKGIALHRKDGKKHKTNAYLDVLRGSNHYVVLCRPICHIGVHFCMKYLKMDWIGLRGYSANLK